MKHTLLIGLVIVSSLFFSSCTTPKSVLDQPAASAPDQNAVSDYQFQRENNGKINIMQESLRIQQNKSLTKAQKSALLIKLQEINRQQLDAELEN